MSEPFDTLRKAYDSMNFPNVPLEESLSCSKAKQILDRAMHHVLAEPYQALNGKWVQPIDAPTGKSSIPEDDDGEAA